MNQKLVGVALLWLRAWMGIAIATHGYAKIFGGNVGKLAQGVAKLGFPAPEVFAWAAALSELVGGILVAVGLATRPAAAFIFITMSVAAFVKHASDPFSVKELALAYWTIAGVLILTGAGPFALDQYVRWGKSAAKKE